MSHRRNILITAVCLLVVAVTGASQSGTRAKQQDPEGMEVASQSKKDIDEWTAQRKQRQRDEERRMIRLLMQEGFQDIKRVLRASEYQWRLVEPKIVSAMELRDEARRGASGCGSDVAKGEIYWGKHGEPDEALADLCFYGATEGKRAADELISVLEDAQATDEQIKLKVDALQRARDKAREQLPEVQRELTEALNGPRQEAALLIMRVLD